MNNHSNIVFVIQKVIGWYESNMYQVSIPSKAEKNLCNIYNAIVLGILIFLKSIVNIAIIQIVKNIITSVGTLVSFHSIHWYKKNQNIIIKILSIFQ